MLLNLWDCELQTDLHYLDIADQTLTVHCNTRLHDCLSDLMTLLV